MSDNILNLIPTSHTYIPDDSAISEAVTYIRLFFPASGEISTTKSALPNFFDQGGNFEKIICPRCGDAIGEDWWRGAMNNAHGTQFSNLAITVPCCGAGTSLNELKYEWPAGFSCFSIEIFSPHKDFKTDELHKIETILGTKLKKIWAHY